MDLEKVLLWSKKVLLSRKKVLLWPKKSSSSAKNVLLWPKKSNSHRKSYSNEVLLPIQEILPEVTYNTPATCSWRFRSKMQWYKSRKNLRSPWQGEESTSRTALTSCSSFQIWGGCRVSTSLGEGLKDTERSLSVYLISYFSRCISPSQWFHIPCAK